MSWFWWSSANGGSVEPPLAPTGLAALGLSPTTIGLSITNGDTATSYKVERRTLPAGSFAQVAAGVAMPYTDPGLTSGTSYEYRIRGTNANGDSPYSNTAQATALNAPPGSFGPPPRTRPSRPWGGLWIFFPWRR